MDKRVKRKVPSFIFYSLIFTVDSPGKSPIVTQRKGMLVAKLLIRYPPETRKTPRMEAVFSPVISLIMTTRGPGKNEERQVLGKYALAFLIF